MNNVHYLVNLTNGSHFLVLYLIVPASCEHHACDVMCIVNSVSVHSLSERCHVVDLEFCQKCGVPIPDDIPGSYEPLDRQVCEVVHV